MTERLFSALCDFEQRNGDRRDSTSRFIVTSGRYFCCLVESDSGRLPPALAGILFSFSRLGLDIMADSPVVFKRSKPKHSQRGRISTPDPDAPPAQDEKGEEEADESPIAIAAKLKKKTKTRTKPKTTLSFGGEEEVRRRHALFR